MSILPDPVSIDLLLFFTIGLLGGAHCIGMCGPLVTVYASKMDAVDARRDRLTLYEVRQHALFNLGRTVSYALLGALFGAIGGAVYLTADQLATVAEAVRGVLGTGIGVLVVGVGIYYLLGRTGGDEHVPNVGLGRLFAPLSGRLSRLASGPGIVGLGALHGLLPCPILYPAFLFAFAMGDPLAGFLALGALGLGTFPAVFVYGTVIDTVDPVRRRQLHRVLGLAFVVLGYVLLAHGLMELGIHLPHPELPHYQPLEDGGGHSH